MNTPCILHYCCGSYDDGSVGGVARYDYHIKQAFPDRKFFQGPSQKNEMIRYLYYNRNTIVITDNHLACDVPNSIPTVLVHHGVARTHAAREPTWDSYWKNLCCSGQDRMLTYRRPTNTIIISPSQFCIDEFSSYFGEKYGNFRCTKILHSSELDETRHKQGWNDRPVVLGNWADANKGKHTVESLRSLMTEFQFRNLSVHRDGKDIEDYNRRKQDIYTSSDMFLQVSACEGFSYSTLDAFLCGLVVVASNVGLLHKDVPEDCFVKLDWERNGDVSYVRERIEFAWRNRTHLSRNARNWYMNNCRFDDWKRKTREVVLRGSLENPSE